MLIVPDRSDQRRSYFPGTGYAEDFISAYNAIQCSCQMTASHLMKKETPRHIFLGHLNRDFLILPSGKTIIDQPGGNVLFAAVGSLVWESEPLPGIVARVGEDYPQIWIDQFKKSGIDTRGLVILPEAVDVRIFNAYIDLEKCATEDPVVHFARVGVTFPRSLLGYQPPVTSLDSRTKLSTVSIRMGDIHPDYLDSGAVHLCPMDYLTHCLFPALLRQAAFTTVTLDPSAGYMNPTFWNDIPGILTGLTAFLPSEKDLRFLFQGRSDDLWEMIEALAAYGCEIVVVKRGERGQYLYETASRNRWEVPAYPARVVDPNGAGSAFCGGFLVGYQRTYNPLEAVLYGNVSASLTIEGNSPFFALDALPSLAQARLAALRQRVRKL